MSFVIVLAVVLTFAASVGAALLISIGRAASLDHDPAIGLFLGRKQPIAEERRGRAPV